MHKITWKREQFFLSISDKFYREVIEFFHLACEMRSDVVSRYYSSCRYPTRNPDWLIPPGAITQKVSVRSVKFWDPLADAPQALAWLTNGILQLGEGSLQLIIPVHPVIGYLPPPCFPRRTRRLNLHTPALHAFRVLRAYRRDAPSLQIGLSRGLHASFSRSVNARKLRNIARSIDRRLDEVCL
jgi:hypothetical protein